MKTIRPTAVPSSRAPRPATSGAKPGRHRHLLGATTCVVAAMALTTVLPAQAAPLEGEHYSTTDSFDFADCGPLVHDEVSSSGVYLLKAPTKPGAPPRYFDNYEVHEVLSANGRTMTIDHNGLYKDLHATLVSGTTYRFVAQESGQPLVARDDTGAVLLHDRGLLRTTFVVDTLGDNDLDNDVFIDGSFELLADNGSHAAFYIDICDVIANYFG